MQGLLHGGALAILPSRPEPVLRNDVLGNLYTLKPWKECLMHSNRNKIGNVRLVMPAPNA